MKKSSWMTVGVMLLLTTACGTSGGSSGGSGASPGAASSPTVKEDTTPVTIKLLNICSTFTDDNDNALEKKINELVQKKYPYITVSVIQGKCSAKDFQDFIASGEQVDIINTYSTFVPIVADGGMMQDQSALIKKHNIDLSRFVDQVVKDTQRISLNGEMWGVPLAVSHWEMLYNKDLFDKFGVPYPKDGMTWDEVDDLAKRMNRSDGGTTYYGMEAWNTGIPAFDRQLGLEPVDPKTDEVLVTSDAWKNDFQWTKKVWDAITSGGSAPKVGSFLKTGNVAMYITPNQLSSMEKVSFQWDIAQYPSIPGTPNIYPNVNPHILSVVKQSKHQDQAMDVISVATSDEFQTYLAQAGTTPVLKSQAVISQYGKNLPYLNGKNVAGIFKSTPAPMTGYSKYASAFANGIIRTHMMDYLNGKVDVNTAMSQAKDEVEQKIKAQK